MSIEEILRAAVREEVRSAVREAVGEMQRTTTGETAQLELYTVDEIASRFKLKPPTVCGWIRSGRLRALADVRPYRVTTTEVERFLKAEQTRTAAAAEPPDPDDVASRVLARTRRK